MDFPTFLSYIPRYSMGASWNGDFLCWPFMCDTTEVAERITEANRLTFLKQIDQYDYEWEDLNMDYFEWDPDLSDSPIRHRSIIPIFCNH